MKAFFKVNGTTDEAMHLWTALSRKVLGQCNNLSLAKSREQLLLGAIIIERVTVSTVVNVKAISLLGDV